MVRFRVWFFVAATLISFWGSGRAWADQWSMIYAGALAGRAASVQQTSDGGFIVAGSTSSSGAGKLDVWVLKLDVSGSVQWQKTYGGPEDDEASSVQQTTDGGYVIAGYTASSGAGKKDFLVLKLDKDGSVEWQKTYGGPEDDEAFSVQQTSDQGFVVAGYTSSFGSGKRDFWVLKLGKDGSVEWQKAYGGPEDDEAFSVQQTADEGYILAGYTSSFGAGKKDIWVLKLDKDGKGKWHKTYGSTGDEAARAIQEISSGGYIIAGWTNSFSSGSKMNAWILKLDADGNILWQKRVYGSSGDDVAYSIEETPNGNFIVGGSTTSFGTGQEDGWIFSLYGGGTLILWQKVLGGTGSDGFFSVQQTEDGGYVAAGWSDTAWPNFNTGDHDNAWVSKLNINGDITGCQIFGNSYASLGSTYVSGIVSGTASTKDTEALPQAGSLSVATPEAKSNALCLVQSPGIVVDPLSADFGSVVLGASSSQTVTVKNDGSLDLVIGDLDISGTHHLDFGFREDRCSGQTVKSSASCAVVLVFTPTSNGTRSAALSVPSNDPDSEDVSIPLKGEGVFPITLSAPANHASFSACSLYDLPTFSWNAVGSFKSYEIQFSKSSSFTSVAAKVKATETEAVIKSNVWKQVILIPGESGGPVYWRVMGTYTGGKTAFVSESRSITMEPAETVKNAAITSTTIASLPTLSWENNCNLKFKAWFGNDAQFSKKYSVSYSVKNPMEGEGKFSQQLTSRQWESVRKLVGDKIGATIYWKVASWDGANRSRETAPPMSFVLGE